MHRADDAVRVGCEEAVDLVLAYRRVFEWASAPEPLREDPCEGDQRSAVVKRKPCRRLLRLGLCPLAERIDRYEASALASATAASAGSQCF